MENAASSLVRLGPSRVEASVQWRECLLAMGGFSALAAAYLHLTIDRFLIAIAPDRGDPLFNLTILRWGAEQARLGFSDFWNPTFFFPTRGVLALSDHLLGPAIGVAVMEALGLPPAATYNLLLVLAFAGSAFTSYLVLRWSGLACAGAAAGAIVWAFAGFRWQEFSHLQVLLALWVPLVLWHFDRLLASPTPRRALWFLLFYLLHISGGAYLAYLIHLPLAALVAVRARERWRDWRNYRELVVLGSSGIVAAAAYVALYLPYRKWQGDIDVMSSFALVRPFLTGVFSWFQVGSRTRYAAWLPPVFNSESAGLFLGCLPLALVLAGLWTRARGRGVAGEEASRSANPIPKLAMRAFALVAGVAALAIADLVTLRVEVENYAGFRQARQIYYSCAAVALLALLLWRLASAGAPRVARSNHELWWAGLLLGGGLAFFASLAAGTMVFRALLPGFASIRVPGRLFMFVSLALAALAGLGLDSLLGRVRRNGLRRGLGFVTILLLALELKPVLGDALWHEIPQTGNLPQEYRWLAEHSEVRAVLELPMLDYWRETERLYFWSFHKRPLVNGYSGYLPHGYWERKERFSGLLDSGDANELSRLGVTHVLVHYDQIKTKRLRREFGEWLRGVESGSGPPFRLVAELEGALILEVESESRLDVVPAK